MASGRWREDQPDMLGQRRRRQRSPGCKLMPGEGRRGALAHERADALDQRRSSPAAKPPASAPRTSRSAVGACGITGPKKRSAGGVGDEQGREVLDVEVAERVGVVLDVDPGEVGVAGELRRQRGEGRAVLAAGDAPRGAQARDQRSPGRPAGRLGRDVQHVVDLVLVRRRAVEVDRLPAVVVLDDRESAASASCRATSGRARTRRRRAAGRRRPRRRRRSAARCATRWSRC